MGLSHPFSVLFALLYVSHISCNAQIPLAPSPDTPDPSPDMASPEPLLKPFPGLGISAITNAGTGPGITAVQNGPGPGVTTTTANPPVTGTNASSPTNSSLPLNGSAPTNGSSLGVAGGEFENVMAEMHHEKEPEVPKCFSDEQAVHCGKLQGIYVKKDDGEFTHTELNDLPLDVPKGKKMIVVVCNYHNSHYDPFQEMKVPLLPKIIRDVGEGSKLSVHIMNSANVDSLRGFKLEAPETATEPKYLIGPVIYGSIGEGASVRIKLAKSANVYYGLYAQEIQMKLGALVGPLIKKFDDKCVEKACISIDIIASGNVIGKDAFPETTFKAAALVASQIWTKCVKESTLRVALKKSANIVNAKSITFGDYAKAVAPLIVSEKAEECKAKVEIEESANLIAKSIGLVGKETKILASAIKIKETEKVGLKAEISKTANLFGKKDILLKGDIEAIAPVIEVAEMKKGAVVAQMGSSGNLIATYGVLLEAGAKCLGSLIKLKEEAKLSMVMAKAVHVCNMWSRDMALKDKSMLVEYLISAKEPALCAFSTKFMGVANAQMKRDMTLAKSGLMKKVIEIEDAKDKFLTKIEGSYSANALCYGPESGVKFEDESVLVGEVLDVGLETKEPSVVNAEIRLEYVGNAWAKTHSVTEFVKAVFKQEHGADRVSISQSKVGKKLVCVPQMPKDKKM